MERIEQREKQKFEQKMREKQEAQRQVIKQLASDESVKIILEYCSKVLAQPITEDLTQYSPVSLSKFVFDQQLNEAKQIFKMLPKQQCKIEHFMVIMIKIMDFPFEKWPFYLVGFKEMFQEIALKKQKVISYHQFFKYIIGEVLDFKQQEQNTEFQVKFQELKKQDYLLHDNGIRKFYYSMDLKYFFTLDQSTYMIKVYNKDMKILSKFTPNKQKHGKKLPQIIWFDYSELTNKLGIALSDSTISVINFNNFLNKTKTEFDSFSQNQIIVSFDQKILKIFYIQMLNKWALFSDENKFYLFDHEKFKQNDPNYLTKIKMEDPDLKLYEIVELVSLSTICVIAGNEIYFYNENFTEKKHGKFSHSTNISRFLYVEETTSYYVCGEEKDITIFNIPRAGDGFKIRTCGLPLKSNIKSFQIFPAMNTLLIVDSNHEVNLYDLAKGTCYQTSDYSQIVKNQNNFIKTLKISKNQFALYETYTLLCQQQKIAIEKDIEFSFLKDIYYDDDKEQFYFSVNNQIISFSLVQGEIRKSYNQTTSNLDRLETFKLGKHTDIFIIDNEKYIYEIYMKDLQPEGQNKNYKKKINITNILESYYDEDSQFVFVVGSQSIVLVKNDLYNNFNVNSSLVLEDLPPIILSTYNQREKQITAMLQSQNWLVINPQNFHIKQYFCYIFPADLKEHGEPITIGYDQDVDYEVDILLTNKNQLYFISKINRQKQFYLQIEELLPRKSRLLKFTTMKYFRETDRISKQTVILCDQTGYMIQINLNKTITENFNKFERPIPQFEYPIKDTHNLFEEKIGHPKQYRLQKRIEVKVDRKDIKFIKAHEKEIKICEKINLQGTKTLSISVEGLIKLWENSKCLFELKLPTLKKMSWEMKKIENIKNQKSAEEVRSILNNLKSIIQQKKSPEKLLKSKYNSNQLLEKDLRKLNMDEPIPIEIQNKDLEEIVQKTQQINWFSARSESKKRTRQLEMSPNTTNFHPWRTKNSFKKIMQKASPENKYKKKMPFDLLYLRNSLDMEERKELSKKKKSQKKQLFILPELNSYQAQKNSLYQKNQNEEKVEEENEETFESCVYVKKTKNRKKINEFDQIDKEFKKKWMMLTAKKWVHSKDKNKKNTSDFILSNKNSKIDLINPTSSKQAKYDPVKKVKEIFQNHNREASIAKKGRLIKIPDLKLRREDLFPE